MTENDTDDVALFDVTREKDGQTWRVPIFLSPLFRILYMEALPSVESRQEMVAGLGARAIVERLMQGKEPPYEKPLMLAIDYPGAPDNPEPLVPYNQVTVRGGEVKAV